MIPKKSQEDLELLAFSATHFSGNSDNVPLKTVYRDAVVGIKYKYPIEAANDAPLVSYILALIFRHFILFAELPSLSDSIP